ncbi:MAG: DUF418 domain-containing protein [Nitriliruptorales bacterium]|nr:DUF418 domain-containing protein [Nitriliruptorales bacterium]
MTGVVTHTPVTPFSSPTNRPRCRLRKRRSERTGMMATKHQEPGALEPVRGGERVVALDALRGLAIVGILLVNIQFFAGPEPYLQIAGEEVRQGADRIAYALTAVLVQGKFIGMFAFLFGLGIAIQVARAERRGHSSTLTPFSSADSVADWSVRKRGSQMLVRRLAVLAVFGALHAVLIWSGDVLFSYALLGFVLLLFRERTVRTLLVWAVALIGIPALLILFAAGLTALAGLAPGGQEALAESRAPVLDSGRALADATQQAYGAGGYRDMVGARLQELTFTYASFPLNGAWILGMMLLGMATGRAGIAGDLAGHAGTVRRVTLLGMLVGLPLNVALAAALLTDPAGLTPAGLAGQALLFAAPPILTLGYLGAGAQVFARAARASLTRRLAAVGRMALTNYLLQSVIATGVFYGLRLYGRTSLVAALGLCLAIAALHLLWSPLWLSRFQYGPMEWLWRRLTYDRLPGTLAGTGATAGGTRA